MTPTNRLDPSFVACAFGAPCLCLAPCPSPIFAAHCCLVPITPRLTAFYTEKQTRFISQLLVEECFNKVKKDVSMSANSRCTPQRAMAVVIDKQVLSSLNHFEEVSREHEIIERSFSFGPHAFKPRMRPDTEDHPTRMMSLRSIVGTGEASWYSPTASTSVAPYADLLICREAARLGTFLLLENTFLCQLASPRLCLRRVGEALWHMCIGDVVGVVAYGWPVRQCDDGTLVPVTEAGTCPQPLVMMQAEVWEAMPVTPISPLRRALLRVRGSNATTSRPLALRDAATYGKLTMALLPRDRARPLLEAAARQGFFELQVPYLRHLADFVGAQITDFSLLAVVMALAKHIIPAADMTDALMDSILACRNLTYEDDEDIEKLCELEYVLDCFDKDDRRTLETEVKGAKNERASHSTYREHLRQWRATMREEKGEKVNFRARLLTYGFCSPESKQNANWPLGHSFFWLGVTLSRLVLPPVLGEDTLWQQDPHPGREEPPVEAGQVPGGVGRGAERHDAERCEALPAAGVFHLEGQQPRRLERALEGAPSAHPEF